jgi:N-dimethylarginine dimethylaminohydrolase
LDYALVFVLIELTAWATELLLENLRGRGVEVVDKFDASAAKVFCRNDRDTLKHVAVSLPTYLDWAGEGITLAEALNAGNKPDRFLAVKQHRAFIDIFLAHQVKVTVVAPSEDCLEGVYIRDVAAAIDDKFILANMVANARQPEEKTVTGGVKPPLGVEVEAGNIVLDGNQIFVGVGRRTNWAAVEWLKDVVGNSREIIPLELLDIALHLDCVFSPGRRPNGHPGGAIIYEAAFAKSDDLKILRKMYGKLHNLPEGEYQKLGANQVWLNPDTPITSAHCPIATAILKEMHFNPIEVDLSQVALAEGLGRCSSLPILRQA